MALKAVVDAVETRLELGFDGCPIIGLNDGAAVPANDEPFIQVTYPVANSWQLTFGAPGSNLWREEGAFRIVINERRGVGTAGALEWADEIAALFRGKHFDGVQTFAPGSPALNDDNDDGNFFQVSFAVPYHADVTG